MVDILEKVRDTFSGAFSSSGSSVLGIDISEASIKVVQLEREGERAKLETYGEIALGPYVDKEVGQAANLSVGLISEALNDLLKEAKVTTSDCGVAVPMSSTLTSFMEVPTVDESKLNDIVPIEARKHIPVPISEVYLDWHVIPREEVEYGQGEAPKEGKTQILMVAIHKESINSFQKVIERADLNASFFEIEIFSTARSVLDRGVAPAMVMDFGVEVTKMYIVEHGLVRGSHIVTRGGQNITSAIAKSLEVSFREAEQLKRDLGLTGADISSEGEAVRENATNILNHIFAKTRQVLVDFQHKQNKSINKVVLTGGGALLKGLSEHAENELDAEVSVANPFDKVRSPAFLDEVLEKAGPEFAVAIGVALRKLQEK